MSRAATASCVYKLFLVFALIAFLGLAAPMWAQQSTTTTVALTTGTNPSPPGISLTFTATVTASGGANDPTGTVTFKDGGTTLCTVTPLTNIGGKKSTATCSTSSLALGAHTIDAYYVSNNSTAQGWTDSDTTGNLPLVQQINLLTPSTAITAHTPSTSAVGQSVQFTVTVTGTNTIQLDGIVQLFDDSVWIGTAKLTPSSTGTATASFSTANLAAGSHTNLTAKYLGNANYNPSAMSSAAATQTVNKRAVSVSITSINPSPAVATVESKVDVTLADNDVLPPSPPASGTRGTFSGTIPLDGTGRSRHAATLMADGTVLVTGGLDTSGNPLNSSRIYSAGAFTAGPTLGTARSGHTATLLQDGTVLVTGGSSAANGAAGSALQSAELYNPATGLFTSLGACPSTSCLATARMNHTATLLPNGNVLIAGGENGSGQLQDVEIYDATAKTFTALAASNNLAQLRSGHSATLISGGTSPVILFVGGDGLGDAELYTLNTTVSPNTGSSVATANNPTALNRSFHTATLLPVGVVAIMGGIVSSNASDSMEFFFLGDNKFYAAASTPPPAVTMDIPRQGHSATLLPDGSVGVAGGSNSADALGGQNTALLYTPSFDPAALAGVAISSEDGSGPPGVADTPTQGDCNPFPPNGKGSYSCEGGVTAPAVGTNDHVVKADFAVTSTHAAGSATSSLTVHLAQATLSVTGPASATFAAADATISTSGGSGGGTITFDAGTSTACSIVSGKLHVTTGTGTCSITATKADDGTYASTTSAPFTVTINKADQAALSVTGPSSAAFAAPDATISTSGGSGGGTITFDAGASTACSIVSGKLHVTAGTGNCSITATKAADPDYNSATSGAFTVTINLGTQATLSVTGPASATYLDADATITTSGGSGSGALSFDAGASTACSIVSGKLHVITATGSCSITATKDADTDYASATSAAFPVTINKAVQATLSVTGPASMTFGDADATITTSGGSGGGAVTFDAGASTACSIVSGQLHVITGTGTCSITATKAADPDYASATSAAFTVTINKADQAALSVTGPASATFAAADATISTLGGSGGGTITFGTGASTACSIVSGKLHVTSGTGNCSITATKAADNDYKSATSAAFTVTINKADQAALSVTGPSSAAFAAPDATISTSGGSGSGALSFDAGASTACSIVSGKLHVTAGTGTCSITATKAADNDYNSTTSGAFTVTIDKASSTTTVTVSDVTYNGAPQGGTAVVTGAGGLNLSLSVNYDGRLGTSYGPSTTPPTNAGDYTASATYAGDADHNGSSDSKNFTIAQAPVTATAGSYSGVYDASPHSTAPACAVTGTYTGDLTCVNNPASVGPDVSSGTVTPSVSGTGLSNFAITLANGSYSITQAPSTTTVTVSNATYDGTPHGGTALVIGVGGLNQSLTVTYAGRSGTSYGPSTTAPTNAGDYTASATFAGDANHAGSSDSKDFSIAQAPVTATAGSYSGVYDGNPHGPSACVVTGTYKGDLACTNNPASVGPGVSSGDVNPAVTGTGLSNFAITLVKGSYSITQAPVTATAGSYSAAYDGSAHSPSPACAVTGAYKGDLTCANNPASVGPDLSSGTVTPSVSGTGQSNFAITSVNGSYSITQATLTITANNILKQLGTAYGFTGTEFAVTGLQGSDTLTGVSLTSAGALADAVAADYHICVAPATSCPAPYTPSLSALTGTNLSNYTIVFNKGTMTVYRAVALVGVASELTVDPTKDAGGTFTLTATVSTNSPVSPTRGTEGVSFADNGTPLAGTVSYSTGVAANGTATIVATLGPVTLNTSTAPHAIAATYHGDTNFEPKTTTVYISVAPRPDPIAAGTTGSAASPSVNVTYSGSLTTSGTLSSTDLACDVLPPPGITMDPTVTRCTATLDKTLNPNDSGALTIAIYTDKIASAPPHKPVGAPLGPLYASFSLTMPAIVFMGLAAPFSMRDKRLRRKVLACIGLVLMLSLLLASMGCGGGGFVNKDNLKATLTSSATQAGNYTVRVTYKDSTGSTQVLASMAVLIT